MTPVDGALDGSAGDSRGEPGLRVPDAAVPYILYQRSALLRFPRVPGARLLRRLLARHVPVFRAATEIERRVRADAIKRAFVEEMAREYDTLASHLPPGCARIVDIGCGVAGIDVLLARHYAPRRPVFHLLDRTQVDGRIFFEYRKERAFYNSLEVAREMLVANGVPEGDIVTLAADDSAAIRVEGEVDLVLSLISWGFHFPVTTYLDEVLRLLSPSGVVILDVRKSNEDGLALLEKVFREVAVLVDRSKYVRIRAGAPRR